MEIDHHLDNGPVMKQSLPSSTASSRQSSRPGTPLVSHCQRRLELTSIMKQYSFGIEYVTSAINGFKINNLEGCPLDVHQHQLLADHEKYLQMMVGEFSSLPPCDTRDCTYHNISRCTPTKTIDQDSSPLTKPISTKTKENEDGFISPR
ncbi:hypothetical protein TNCV_1235261 [Trichonephila clavipes]|nr:hypothetical protein TNCV_1235261 [Trichonephila clavipes]